MTQEEFAIFKKILKNSLDLSTEALGKVDDAESSEKWRDVFGSKFPLVRKPSKSSSSYREGPVTITNPSPWSKS